LISAAALKNQSRRFFLFSDKPAGQVYYSADNASGYLVVPYARILIRNKHPEQPKEVQ